MEGYAAYCDCDGASEGIESGRLEGERGRQKWLVLGERVGVNDLRGYISSDHPKVRDFDF